MKRTFAASVLMVALVFAGGNNKTWAQESSSPAKAAENETPRPLEAYRLDFSINELEDGKRINTRQYSIDLTKDQPGDIKIGTKVPVETKEGGFEYIDVGTNISGRLQARSGEPLQLFVHAEMSSFAIPEQAQNHEAHSLIRQLKIGGSTLVALGKPIVIGVADDPSSKRQFQVEVTMTKLR